MKEKILCFFKEIFERETLTKSLNSTFMVLIPKKIGANDLKNFRPISLMGSLYKILISVLANRLKK